MSEEPVVPEPRKVTRLKPIEFGKYCIECLALGRKTTYDTIDRDRDYKDLFIPARIYQITGVGGTGKSFLANALIWSLLHNRLIEYHFIVNFKYEKIIERVEREIIIGDIHELQVYPIPKDTPAKTIHPRIYEVRTMAEALEQVGLLLDERSRNLRPMRICLFIDEAPNTKLTGGASTQGRAGSASSVQAQMNELILISRKVEMLMFLIGWDELLFSRRLRSGKDDEEGTIQDMVVARFSKNPDDIQQISAGYWPEKKRSRKYTKPLNFTYRIDPNKSIQQYAAFIPFVAGWEPGLLEINATPLCKREEDCQVGDTTYSNRDVGGMEMGKKRETNKILSLNELITYLQADVPVTQYGAAILRFLHVPQESTASPEVQKTAKETVNDFFGPEDDDEDDEPETPQALPVPEPVPTAPVPASPAIKTPRPKQENMDKCRVAREGLLVSHQKVTKEEFAKLAGVSRQTLYMILPWMPEIKEVIR